MVDAGGSAALAAAKQELRGRMRTLRAAIPPAERERRSALIAAAVLELAEVGGARNAACFASFGSEVRTASLIDALASRGVTVLLPYLAGGEISMTPFVASDPTVPTAYGPREPESRRPADPQSIDVVVVPGLAFDESGRRLGYGGGFYDRFLRRLRRDASTVAVAFEEQIVGSVPAGPDDSPVDVIVTDRRVIRRLEPGAAGGQGAAAGGQGAGPGGPDHGPGARPETAQP